MKLSPLPLLKACTLSVALLGSTAIVAAVAIPDVAYAKSGNDNGGGNGNGNGGGNGNGNGSKSGVGAVEKSGGSASKDKSAGSTKSKPKAAAKTKKKSLADDLGISASELGALNAARANANALKNASPNSRVGRIAAYRDAVLAGDKLQADLDAMQAKLEALTPPERSTTEVQTDLAIAQLATDEKAGFVGNLEQALADAGGSDAAIEAELETARAELTSAQQSEAALQSEYDNALAYESLSAEVDDLAEQVENQPELERSLLEAAANKPVTDEVEAAVRKLLGL